MPSRYERPAPKPPSLDDLSHYLRDAEPTQREMADDPVACEKRRVEAVRKLRQLARDLVTQANAEKPLPAGYSRLRAMPVELREFLEINGLRILLAEESYDELEWFLGQGPPRRKKRRRKKGRPAEDNERRNHLIATDVCELVDGGMTVDAACETVVKQALLGFEMVKKIYQARDRGFVDAELWFRRAMKQRPVE